MIKITKKIRIIKSLTKMCLEALKETFVEYEFYVWNYDRKIM